MSLLIHTCIIYFFKTLCSSYLFVKLLHLPTNKKTVAALITAAVGIGTVTGIARQYATFASIYLMVALTVAVELGDGGSVSVTETGAVELKIGSVTLLVSGRMPSTFRIW